MRSLQIVVRCGGVINQSSLANVTEDHSCNFIFGPKKSIFVCYTKKPDGRQNNPWDMFMPPNDSNLEWSPKRAIKINKKRYSKKVFISVITVLLLAAH